MGRLCVPAGDTIARHAAGEKPWNYGPTLDCAARVFGGSSAINW